MGEPSFPPGIDPFYLCTHMSLAPPSSGPFHLHCATRVEWTALTLLCNLIMKITQPGSVNRSNCAQRTASHKHASTVDYHLISKHKLSLNGLIFKGASIIVPATAPSPLPSMSRAHGQPYIRVRNSCTLGYDVQLRATFREDEGRAPLRAGQTTDCTTHAKGGIITGRYMREAPNHRHPRVLRDSCRIRTVA